MALVECKNCGGQICDENDKCLRCDKLQKPSEFLIIIASIVFIVIAILAINQYIDSNRNNRAYIADKGDVASSKIDGQGIEVNKPGEVQVPEEEKGLSDKKRMAARYLAGSL